MSTKNIEELEKSLSKLDIMINDLKADLENDLRKTRNELLNVVRVVSFLLMFLSFCMPLVLFDIFW